MLQSREGIGIDIALGALDFERLAIERASDVEVMSGKYLNLCSAEDLVVMKAFPDRPLDWHDIEGIIIRQGSASLDWSHVFRQLEPLCEVKEGPEILSRPRRLQQG